MLATRDVKAFFLLDLLTHATFFFSAAGLMRFLEPAESASIGFLISYAVYFVLCYAYARTRHGFRFGVLASSAWLTGLLLVVGTSASTWSDPSVSFAKSATWIVLGLSFSAGFAVHLRRRSA
jgi:hypothetical protein